MDETDRNIRDSALSTLKLLASADAQRDFASKVPYDSYQGEFAAWWFDTFLPEAPNANVCFSASEVAVLKEFSSRFGEALESLGYGPATIEQLLANETWREVISSARHACVELGLQA